MGQIKQKFYYNIILILQMCNGFLSQNIGDDLLRDIRSSTLQSIDSAKEAGRLLFECLDKCNNIMETVQNNRMRIDLNNVYKITTISIRHDDPGKCCDIGISKTGEPQQCVSGSGVGTTPIQIESSIDAPLPDSRYIFIESLAQLPNITEIQIFGVCPENYCGLNCTEFCFCKSPLTSAEKNEGRACTSGCRAGWSGDRCNNRKCDGGWFGLGCLYRCHCVGQCDPWTGECIGRDRRCIFNWYGPSCQKQNDGILIQDEGFGVQDINTCAFAKQQKLTFDVPIKISMVDITISRVSGAVSRGEVSLQHPLGDGSETVIKEFTSRRLGCGNKLQLTFLANESNITNPNESDITSLLIQVANNDIFICAVRFSSCEVGSFGPECNFRCHCSHQSPCKTIDGACPGATCEKGWEGIACNMSCAQGTFGTDCKDQCHCLSEGSCDPVSGKCPGGCSDGWTGLSCDSPCSAGRFGDNCQYVCGQCADEKPCDHVNGSCYNGCREGWHGTRCGRQENDDNYDHNHDNHDHDTADHDNHDSHDPDDPDDADYLFKPDDDDDATTIADNCTECGDRLKAIPDSSSNDMLVAYGILGASMTILIILTTVVVVCAVRRRRDRLSKSIPTRHFDVEVGPPHRTEITGGAGEVHVVEAQIEEVVELIDMEADVLDDDVLKIYDDDFVLDTDPNGPLPLARLWCRILELRNDDDMLLKEFASLPIGICDSVDDAFLPENKKKNRYNGVYPYDFNRVKLKRIEANQSSSNMHLYDNVPSDYINASYFKGFKRENAYIVTQGPLEWTRGDFWEMVWQEQTTQIVMLTNLIEDRKIKCSQYWPDESKAHFGKVSIKHVSSTSMPNFTVTELQIRVSTDGEPRTVRHYHYETWPDKNIPDNAWNLVDFWRYVRASRQDSDGPLVIHCSAGIGRSGTYVGLDYLYDQAMARGSVKLFDCVRTMRRYRLNMVQTKLQYLYLHEVVAEAVHAGSSPIDQQLFQDYTEELLKIDPKSGATNMQIQYENLCEGIALSLSEEQDQIYANNRSEHVKALYLKNHEGEERYLVVQSCYITEDEEFWRNVYTTHSATIVTFENEEPRWIENDESKQIGDIELTQTGEDLVHTDYQNTDLFIRRTLSVKPQDADPHEVHMFEALFWNGDTAQGRIQEILCFIDYVIEWQKHRSGTKNIVLQYGDDSSSLGPFLVIYDELDRLTKTNKIGIYEAVWRYKSAFPNMIPDFKQYSMCYTALAERQKASTTYYNM